VTTERAGADAEDFSALFVRARTGDPAAVGALYARYCDRVLSAVRPRLPRALRRRYDTMDVAQSVFAEILRDLPRLENRGEAAFVRLLQIKSVNKIRRRMKSELGRDGRRAERRLGTDDGHVARDGDVAGHAGSIDDDVKLHRLLAGLDPATREILRLRGEKKTFAEIAAATGLASADAARMRHARAVVELRRRWDAETTS
jgi:DNA-directed RNA polymerase specialized sigma24 family protein